MSKISLRIILSLTLVIMIVAGIFGFLSQNLASDILKKESSEKFKSISESHAHEFSILLKGIESTVDTIVTLAGADFDIEGFQNNEAYRNDYMNELNTILESIGEGNDIIQGLYVAIDPSLTGRVYESWFVYDSPGSFIYQEPEDISEFYPENADMDWYYNPISAGEGVWSMPYTDATIRLKMISYTAPIYSEDQLIGVAGIDISFEEILETILSMKFYESGYAVLLDHNHRVIIHPEIIEGTAILDIGEEDMPKVVEALTSQPSGVVNYIYQSQRKLLGFSRLINGWYFLVIADSKEINEPLIRLRQDIILISLLVTAVAVLIGIRLSSGMVAQLNQLIHFTKEIREGRYDVEIHKTSDDELGQLVRSFAEMSHEINRSQSDLRARSNDMEHQALHDPLTRLPNRRYSEKKLLRLLEDYSPAMDLVGIMSIDLNAFKQINDTYGHGTGDVLLMHISEMMRHAISSEDDLCRFGGDEFLVIFRKVPTHDHLNRLIRRLQQSMSTPLTFNESTIHVTGSIGVAFITDRNMDMKELLKQADTAMYEAKKKGNDTYFIYGA